MDVSNKSLVTFIITSEGYLRVNLQGPRILYVCSNSNFHKKFNKIFLGKCAMPTSWYLTNNMRNLRKDLGRIPFKK